MGPSWIPLCKVMQRYCEAYFAAIENWARYQDRNVLVNRLVLLECACELFKLYSEKPNTYVFEIVCANNSAPLLHEVFPSAGKNFVIGGDVQVYTAVKDRVPKNLFSKAGVYFQTFLLNPLAGWNSIVLAASNLETRKSISLCVDELFRLAESAGEGHFTITETIVDGVETKGVAQIFTSPVLSETGCNFYDFLIEYVEDDRRKQVSKKRSSDGQSSSSAATQRHKRSKHTNSSNDETGWISKHSTIGTKVAAYFPPVATEGVPRKLFTGVVVKYLPDTNADADDRLFRILWEDGDEQDYDDKDLELGIKTFDQVNGWTIEHTSVGTNVGVFTPVAITEKGQAPQFKLLKGVVTKFAPATDTDPLELYHIEWEDGKEQDYEIKHLQRGIQLYYEAFELVEEVEVIKEVIDVDDNNNEDDEHPWIFDHTTIGTKVAAYFACRGDDPDGVVVPSSKGKKSTKKMKPYAGVVTKYVGPSAMDEADQLYHILWEDGDNEDYDQKQFEEGKKLYYELYGRKAKK